MGRDRASFALPPSLGHLGAGDVVKLAEPGGLASYRIDQFEQGDQGLAQAVRVDETLYEGSSLAQKPLELPAAYTHNVGFIIKIALSSVCVPMRLIMCGPSISYMTS